MVAFIFNSNNLPDVIEITRIQSALSAHCKYNFPKVVQHHFADNHETSRFG